jgi:hypothetical protein
MSGTADPTPAPTPAPTPTPTPAPWYQGTTGLDAELTGHIQNKGWHNLTPAEAAVAAARSHREAERTLGLRADHDVVMVPKNQAAGDMAPVWEKLGKPKAATDYDFADVKFPDGSPLPDDFANFMREKLFAANLPKSTATDVARAIAEYVAKDEAGEAALRADALAADKAALAKSWGSNQAANLLVAQNAVRALGLEPETVATLEGVVGYGKVMEMFRQIGSRIGEDAFVTAGGKGIGNGGIMSIEQAIARKAELRADPAFVRRFTEGEAQARREMLAIDTILSGV